MERNNFSQFPTVGKVLWDRGGIVKHASLRTFNKGSFLTHLLEVSQALRRACNKVTNLESLLQPYGDTVKGTTSPLVTFSGT